MELVMCMPIVTVVIALSLDQILKVIISHWTVEDRFDLIFIFTVDECQWWGRGGLTSWDRVWKRVWESDEEFDNRKNRMKLLKLRR
jgi:hypothetical protein